MTFDGAQDIDYQKEVGKNVIFLISDKSKEKFIKFVKEMDIWLYLTHAEVKFMYGEIGELYINVLKEDDEFEVMADFVFVDEIKEYMLRQSGIFRYKPFNR